MYHVFGTGITAIILYLLSYFFFRIGYYSVQVHKKLWNAILAIFFIITAFAGIYLALQTNYKWSVPIIKSILKWHVEFGIGMAVTGIFHFIWHLSYFGKLFKSQEKKKPLRSVRYLTDFELRTNLFIVGFISSSVQFLLIREILNISGGYESVAGVFLCSWLISSAVGVSLATRSGLNDIKIINLVFSLSPIFSLLLMFVLSRLFLSTGETPTFLTSIIFTFLVLLPFCLASGFTFLKVVTIARSGNAFLPGKSFSIETAGGIASGIIISFLTSGIVNTYKLLLLVIMLAVSYVFFGFFKHSFKVKIFAWSFVGALLILIALTDPDIFFRQILMPGIKVNSSVDTPYGNLTKGSYKGDQSIYYNQRLINYNDDVIEREEDIQYAVLQRDSVEKIILISGSLQSHISELSKFHPKKIIYIERDPVLAKSEQSVLRIFSGELVIANEDAFNFIRRSDEQVDAIILLLPPPSTLQLNRYYSTEFFSEIKKRLRYGGVFMCSPGLAYNYYNKESINLYSSIYNSLSIIFRNVCPVAGNKLYFISSDKNISLSFCQMAKIRGISNIYISSDYLSDELIAKKSEEIRLLMDPGQSPNSFAFPNASFHFQSLYLSESSNEKGPVIVLMLLLSAIPFLTIKKRNIIMYFSAFALAALEIVLLFTLQLTMGSMYQLAGLLIAGLMAGLALGSAIEFPYPAYFSLKIKSFMLFVFYAIFGIGYNFLLSSKNGLLVMLLLLLLAIIPAFLTGSLFRELTMRTKDSGTSAVYRADLIGSACGFLLISVLTVPSFGLKVSIFLLSLLTFIGFLFGTIINKE
jgi:spermidine synthase